MEPQADKKKQAKKPVGPEATPTRNVWTVSNLNTQEVDNLLADEEEFLEAIDDMEHGIGINKSMIEWANINFNSSFGGSGEFEGRVPVEKLVNCVDCETNSKTINMQTDLLTKLDKKLQDCQNQLKTSKKHEKQLEIKLSDSLKKIQKLESSTVETTMVMSLKCRECEYVCGTEEELREHKRKKKAEFRAKNPAYRAALGEGPLPEEESKCEKCSFVSKNRVLLEEHREKQHKGINCTRCGEVLPDMESLKKHGEQKHSYPGYALNFKCTPCKENFMSDDDLMEHMHQVHLTKAQREGQGLYKYPGYKSRSSQESRPPLCRNGPQCYYHRHNRCNFFHHQAPRWQQGRPPRQAPSSQWQEVPDRWNNVQQGQGVHSAYEPQAQGHKYWSIPPKGVQLVPWCLHGRGCPMGQYCVLRHEDTDFLNLPTQGGQ